MSEVDPTIHAAAGDLAELTRRAHAAADQAVIALSELMSGTLRARRTTPVADHAAQEALLRLHRGIGRALEATSDVARVHGALGELYADMAGPDVHPWTEGAIAQKGQAPKPLGIVAKAA